MTPFRGALLALMGLSPTGVLAQDPDHYHVRAEHLACVVENLAAYRAQGDPVFIDVTKCPPEPGDGSDLFGALVNEMSEPDFMDGYDTFLALTPADLDCLARADLPGAATVRFYPAECRIEPGS